MPATLRARAALLAQVRAFFAERDVIEVDTPLLCSAGVTDPNIDPLIVAQGLSVTSPRYLQTSPEYAMKRLLVAGSGPIYQLGKAFRDGEAGRRHNPEFTMLEWYRPGFDDHDLMAEVAALLSHCLGEGEWCKISYRDLFLECLQIDPWTIDADTLLALTRSRIELDFEPDSRDTCLDLLMTHCIEPRMSGRVCVFGYPASQAALARVIDRDGVSVAQRFEVYVDGLELANGYYELGDADELRARFEADNRVREERGQMQRPLDEAFLEAMAQGLPDCAGVALGFDRLLALHTGESDIRRLMPFDWANC